MKILTYNNGKGFQIQQSKMIVEHFIWKCPYCEQDNKSLEFYVRDNRLFCNNCSHFTIYSFQNSQNENIKT